LTIIDVYELREKEWILITWEKEGKGVCDDPKRPCTKEAIYAFVYTLYKQSHAWLCNSFVVIGHRLSIIDHNYVTIEFYFMNFMSIKISLS